MTKLILPAAALFALTFAFATADTAEARGFHFSTGRVHVDVGNPHGGGHHGNHGNHGYNGNYSQTVHRAFYPQQTYWGGGWGGAHQWHDTSHYDYHPTQYRWHNGHIDVTPGHYDWHQTGHVDHLHP